MADTSNGGKRQGVIGKLLEICEQMHAEGAKVTPTALKERAGGHSWRDVVAACGMWNDQFRLPEGSPEIPEHVRNSACGFIERAWAELCSGLAVYKGECKRRCDEIEKNIGLAIERVTSENEALAAKLEEVSEEAGRFARKASESDARAAEAASRLHEAEVSLASVRSERDTLQNELDKLHERLLKMASPEGPGSGDPPKAAAAKRSARQKKEK